MKKVVRKSQKTREKELLDRVKDLELRLAEAEETLRAIRSGEVDTLSIETVTGMQIFTLKGAGYPYRTIVENVSEGAVTLLPDGTITYVNQRFADMLGFTLEKIMGSFFHYFVHERGKAGFLRLLGDSLTGKQKGEFLLSTARGGYLPVALSTNPLPIEEQVSVSMVITDLTEQKKREDRLDFEVRKRTAELENVTAELKAQNLEMRSIQQQLEEDQLDTAEIDAIFKAQNDIVLLYDTQMNVQRVNPSFHTIYRFDPVGLNIKDIIRRVSARLLDGQTFILEEQPTPRALQGEKVTGALFMVTRADGSEAVVETSSTPIWVGDRITGSVTVWHDITDLKQAEEAIRQSETQAREQLEEIQTIYDSAPVALCVLDRSLRYVRLNHRLAELNGVPASDHIGKTPREIVPDLAPWIEGVTERIFQTGEPVLNMEFNGTTPSRPDVVCTFLVNWLPLKNADGSIFGINVVMEDITEHKKAEEALKESEERLRLSIDLLEAVTAGTKVLISSVDENFRYTYFNAEHQRELKLLTDKDTAIGMSLMEVLADMPEQRKIAIDLWSRALKGETVVQTISFGDPGRYRRFYNTRHAPIRDADGVVVGAGEVTSDVTEFIQAQEALRESEERMQFALTVSRSGAWDLDLVNNTAFRTIEHDRIFGYEELLPHWTYEMFLEHVLAEDRGEVERKFQKAIREQSDLSFECRIVRRDGMQRWIWACGQHHRDAEGCCHRIAGIVQDITERKQNEIDLQKAKEDLEGRVRERTAELKTVSIYTRRLIETNLDPLVTISASGKITDVNAATELVTGLSRGELLGSDFSDYFTEPEKARAGYEKVFEEGFVRDYPLAIRHRSGRITEVLYNASTYRNEEGDIQGVFAAARDVTELRQAQNELRKSYDELERRVEARTADLKEKTVQLEAANKELESFSYSVSHDLRAPLRAIDGYARMILKKEWGKFDEDTTRKFNAIRSNAHMMGQLIDDLLSFSRLSKKQLSASKLDMESIIMDVWKELQIINPERNMNLSIHSMPPVYGDRTLIKQVCSNLLANAVKFTKNQDAAHIEVGCFSNDDGNICYVKDNGIGFDMAYYEKLFGIFQRLHSVDDFEGTGVGLATVQRIIHRHGGRVWAEGKVNEGATFYFALPGKKD